MYALIHSMVPYFHFTLKKNYLCLNALKVKKKIIKTLEFIPYYKTYSMKKY